MTTTTAGEFSYGDASREQLIKRIEQLREELDLRKATVPKLSDLRMVYHPKGRDAMIGWLVRTPEGGTGVITQFASKTPQGLTEDKVLGWGAIIEAVDPKEQRGEKLFYLAESLEAL